MDVQGFMLATLLLDRFWLVVITGLSCFVILLIRRGANIEKRLNQLEEQQKPKDGGGE